MKMMTTTTFSSSSSPFSNRNNPKTQLQKYSLSLFSFSQKAQKTRQKRGRDKSKNQKKDERERSIFFQQMEEEILYLSLSLFLFFFFFFLRERYQREERTIGSRLMESFSLSRRARALGGFKKNIQSIKSSLPLLRFFPKRERESNSFLFLCPGRENIWREKPKKRKTKSLLSLFLP
jgi:hypothetical protein